MKHLLDTHVLIWSLTDDRKLPKRAFTPIRSTRSFSPARCNGLTLLTMDERIIESGVVAVM